MTKENIDQYAKDSFWIGWNSAIKAMKQGEELWLETGKKAAHKYFLEKATKALSKVIALRKMYE